MVLDPFEANNYVGKTIITHYIAIVEGECTYQGETSGLFLKLMPIRKLAKVACSLGNCNKNDI